ncbi:DMT family transporter [Candidatus Saccharibacteria bacterium]|nr:DMT family transporter [Candidatus Saccharibacteria bacterium]
MKNVFFSIAVFVVMMLLCNMTEAAFADGAQGAHTRGRRNRNPIKKIGQFIVQTFRIGVGAWVRSLLFAIIATVCVGFGPAMSAKIALFFTIIMLGFIAYTLYWWITDGNRFIEAVFMALVICLLSVSAATVAARAVAVTGSVFWASVIQRAPAIVALLVCGYIFVSLTWEARQIYEKVLGGIIASVLIIIAVVLAIFSIRWAALLPAKADDDNTGAAPVQLAPQTSETEVEEGEMPAEPLATSGPNWGTTEYGVWHDYAEYADFDNKVKLRAFGYDYSSLWQDEDALKEAFLQIAENEPEALAFYSFDFFNKEEKKALGINGLKVGTDFRTGDYAGIDANFDKEGGGELQEDLYQALSREVLSDNVRFNPIKTTGLQKTSYIYWEDLNKDGYITPEECFCCYDNVSRKDALQVEVQRKVQKMGKDGGYTWETKFILNLDCGFQICWKDKVPKGVPQISEVPTASGNNPPPTPDPGPGPGPNPNPKKDKSKGTQGDVVKPNDNKGTGPDTNNPSNPQESKAEEHPNSTDNKTYSEYKQEVKELKDVNADQKQGGDPNTPTEPTQPGTNVDSNAEKGTGNGGIDKKTEVKPVEKTGGTEIKNNSEKTAAGKIAAPD